MKNLTIPLTCLLLGAALQSGGAEAADAAPAPAPQALYIRGAFNGWGTDNALRYLGKGIYQTDIVISPGNHAFKVGDKDWHAEWVLNPNASMTLALATDYPMDTHPGPEDYLFVKKTAAYTFRLDLSNAAVPVLRVTRVDAAALAPHDPHAGHAARAALTFATFDGQRETARFSSPDAGAALRSYAQSTTQQLRDPGAQYVTYQESAQRPRVRSGNLAFDALFALAGAEMAQDSVREIRDGNYNGGDPIACDCFETGEKWHYVWTRDLSYAATLGLAMLDPQRTVNSLNFKLSGYRAGVPRPANVAGSADGLQIIQDTGSGGSWPVSTDRVSWAFGAEEVLKTLAPAQRAVFAKRALAALSNTIENDRLAAYDVASGLYSGEQSFLDWRDQSYAAWIVNDIASLASSRALSTNVGHYKALTLAATLAREQRDAARATKYDGWAQALKEAINTRLWLPDAGMYSSLTAAHFDGAPLHKFDWLGQSLAILTGVADPARARQILAHYPHGPMGAPVIYPQQPDMPIYHNRAIWPFVTAYGLKAAALAGNVSVADAAYDTLLRGAALNLSNMENLEWLSGQPLLLDEAHPGLIGPVINSRRQLWSVGAYLGMVIGDVFGVATTKDGIRLRPFVTTKLRREQFGQARQITLSALRLRDKQISVTLLLPAASDAPGYYSVAAITQNGKPVAADIGWNALAAHSHIEIRLGAVRAGEQGIVRVNAEPAAQSSAVFGPPEPALVLTRGDARAVTLTFGAGAANTVYNVYRDGQLVATRLAPGSWIERAPAPGTCYALEAQFADSGNRSHHSAPQCVDGAVEIAASDARVRANIGLSAPNARFAAPHIAAWGKPGDSFSVNDIALAEAGNYRFQIHYHNAANMINLGISGGVKWLSVSDAGGHVVAQGVVQLPHARVEKSNTPTVYSTPLAASLPAGVYRLALSDFYNMSYLASNAGFSAAGGAGGPANQFDIYGVRVQRAQP